MSNQNNKYRELAPTKAFTSELQRQLDHDRKTLAWATWKARIAVLGLLVMLVIGTALLTRFSGSVCVGGFVFLLLMAFFSWLVTGRGGVAINRRFRKRIKAKLAQGLMLSDDERKRLKEINRLRNL